MTTRLEQSAESLVLVDAQVIYPTFGLRITLASPHREPLQIVNENKTVDLMINASNDNQKKAATESLCSLLTALNLTLPPVATHQPPQIVAASYARLLQTASWHGSLFTAPRGKLQLINVRVSSGISSHHHKKYLDYQFTSEGRIINRDNAQIDYTPSDNWWYYKYLNPAPLNNIPTDFLLWFDKNKHDRGDQVDYPLITKVLNITNNKLLQALFYQLKFEIADVICCPPFYNRLPRNLPGNIFQCDPRLNVSLTGLIFRHYQLHGCRPNAAQIYWAGVKGQLPDQSWNGKWVSNNH